MGLLFKKYEYRRAESWCGQVNNKLTANKRNGAVKCHVSALSSFCHIGQGSFPKLSIEWERALNETIKPIYDVL